MCGVCAHVCVPQINNISNQPLRLSTLDKTPNFTGVFQKIASSFDEEIFTLTNLKVKCATASAHFETIISHSLIYLAYVLYKTAWQRTDSSYFYPPADSLSGMLFLKMCEITLPFIWIQARQPAVFPPECYERVLCMLLESIGLKKKKPSSWSITNMPHDSFSHFLVNTQNLNVLLI